jgi:hypothetical protein
MAKNIIQSAPHKEIQSTLHEAMQGICFWVAHRHSYYYKHPLPEGAIVAELANLIEGRLPTGQHLYCEIMMRHFLHEPFSQHFQDQRADLIITSAKTKPKEYKDHYFADTVNTVIEVKRGVATKALIDDDLKKLSKIKHFKPDLSTYLMVVSEYKLPRQYDWFAKSGSKVNAADVVATKQRIYVDAIEGDVVVRRVCKAMASSKAKQVHTAVLVEVL